MAMPIPASIPRYTIDDLDAFPDDGNKYDLVDGVLLVTPAPLPCHEVVVSRLCGYVLHFFGPRGLASVFTRGAVEVAPRNHLEPDLLVIPNAAFTTLTSRTRWTAIQQRWLAVEVSGSSSRIYNRDFKRPAYLALGVGEVWRADLRDACVYVSRPEAPAERRVTGTLTWHPPAVPGPLRLEVPELFEGIRDEAP